MVTAVPSDTWASEGVQPRIVLRQPMSPSGFVDAAWWPRSTNLSHELSALLRRLWSDGHQINRVTFNLKAWEPAPRLLRLHDRVVRLGGFATSDPATVRLTDSRVAERIDVLVIAATTDPAVAERALEIAGRSGQLLRPAEILVAAATAERPGGAQKS